MQLTGAGVVRGRAGLVNRAGERYRLDGLTLLLPAGPDAAYALELGETPVRSCGGPRMQQSGAIPSRHGRVTILDRPAVLASPVSAVPSSGRGSTPP